MHSSDVDEDGTCNNQNNVNNDGNGLTSPIDEQESQTAHYDPYEHVLNVTTHNEALYAYYYSHNQQEDIENVRDLLELSKNMNMNQTDLENQHEETTAKTDSNWNDLHSGKK